MCCLAATVGARRPGFAVIKSIMSSVVLDFEVSQSLAKWLVKTVDVIIHQQLRVAEGGS